jgi:hypothetical protein
MEASAFAQTERFIMSLLHPLAVRTRTARVDPLRIVPFGLLAVAGINLQIKPSTVIMHRRRLLNQDIVKDYA